MIGALSVCSEGQVVEVGPVDFGLFGGSGASGYLCCREWLHRLPVDGRADDLPGVRVLLRLHAAMHLKAFEVFGGECRYRLIIEVARLYGPGKHSKLAILLVCQDPSLACLYLKDSKNLAPLSVPSS